MQLVMWAARNASELGRWAGESSWWQTGHSSSSAMRGRRGIRGSGRVWWSARAGDRIPAETPDGERCADVLAGGPDMIGRVG